METKLKKGDVVVCLPLEEIDYTNQLENDDFPGKGYVSGKELVVGHLYSGRNGGTIIRPNPGANGVYTVAVRLKSSVKRTIELVDNIINKKENGT